MTRTTLAAAGLLTLAACNGTGPQGNGLGAVQARGTVNASGDCSFEIVNGKDQTNLSVSDLTLCGGHLGELHADKSDGAQAAIAANAQITQQAIAAFNATLGQLIPLLVKLAGTAAGAP